MKILWNIIWHIPFLWFITAIITFLFWVILLLTIIWYPLGLWLINLSKFLLLPFSYEMVNKSEVEFTDDNILIKILKFLLFIVYLPIWITLCILLIIQIILLFFTIVWIPAAAALAKSLPSFFNPINKVCIPSLNL